MNILYLHKIRENLYLIKWAIIGFVIFAMMGGLIGITKVYLVEQSDTGKSALYNQCIYWNEDCIKQCEIASRSGFSSSCGSCCIQWGIAIKPLGKRMEDVARLYGWIGGGIGLVIGLSYAQSQSEKKKIWR